MAKEKLYPHQFMERARPILASIAKAATQTTPATDTMETVGEAKATLVMVEAAAAQLRTIVESTEVARSFGSILM